MHNRDVIRKKIINKYSFLLVFLLLSVAFLLYFNLRSEYIEVGNISDRLTEQPQLLRNMLHENEVLVRGEFELDTSSPNYHELKELRDEMLRDEIYCSYNIEKNIEQISNLTGVYQYKGETDLVSLEEFKRHVAFNDAYCVRALTLNPESTYYDVDKMIIWSIESEGLKIYRKR